MEDLRTRFALDELDRLAAAEEYVLTTRNTVLAHLFAGSGVGMGFWAAISKEALISPDWRAALEPPYLSATFAIFGFLFAGSFVCWLRLMNGTAKLSLIRVQRMVVRHELSRMNFCMEGYSPFDINRASGLEMVPGQKQGFHRQTIFGFVVYILALAVVGSILVFIVAHLITLAKPPLLPPNIGYLGASIVSASLLLTMVAILTIWIKRVRQRSRAVLGNSLHARQKSRPKRPQKSAKR